MYISNTKAPRKMAVRFCRTCQVRVVPTLRNGYTDEERSAMWYDDNEMEAMSIDMIKVIKEYRLRSQAHQDHRVQVAAENDDEEKEIDEIRGLEHVLSASALAARKALKDKCLDAVLVEQDRLWAQSSQPTSAAGDTEASLRSASVRVSYPAACAALARGAGDAAYVRRICQRETTKELKAMRTTSALLLASATPPTMTNEREALLSGMLHRTFEIASDASFETDDKNDKNRKKKGGPLLRALRLQEEELLPRQPALVPGKKSNVGSMGNNGGNEFCPPPPHKMSSLLMTGEGHLLQTHH